MGPRRERRKKGALRRGTARRRARSVRMPRRRRMRKAKEKKDKAIKKERDSKYQEKKSKELKAKEKSSKERTGKERTKKAERTSKEKKAKKKERKAKEKKSKEKKAKAKEKASKQEKTGKKHIKHVKTTKEILAKSTKRCKGHAGAVITAIKNSKKICAKEKKAEKTTKEKKVKAKATGPTFNFNTGSPCKGGKGSFVRKLKLNARVDVGIIPAGMNNVWVKLRTDKDVDTELWTVKNKKQREIAIVAWRVGKINSPTSASMKYNGATIKYSGYNGVASKDGSLNFGHEDISIVGKSPEGFMMKAFAFEAGTARITYSWGVDPAKCKAQKEKLRKERKAKHDAKAALKKRLGMAAYKKARKALIASSSGCKGAKAWVTTTKNALAKCHKTKGKHKVHHTKAVSKEKAFKKKHTKPKVNPVSGKPCNSKAGPICHGYNLKCWRSGTLAKCKKACAADKRCNLAEYKASSETCCTSAIATKKACKGRWAKANGWIGYNICSKKTMVLLQTGAVKCGSTGRVNPVSGKPCGSKAGPICHGYNLKCWRSGTLGNCKSACKKDRRCNLAEL